MDRAADPADDRLAPGGLLAHAGAESTPWAALRRAGGRVVAAVRRRPGVADAVTAFVLLDLLILGVLTVEPLFDAPLPLALAFAAGTTVPLAWRRRAPLSVLVVVTAAFTAFRLLEVPETTFSSVALFLALYSAGAFGARVRRDVVRGLAVAALMVLLAVQLVAAPQESPSELNIAVLQVYSLALNLYFFAAAWVLGDVTRQRNETAAALAERHAQLVAERAANARRAVLAERVRIARELHDVVAHHVSLMGIQAGAARHVLSRDLAAAGAALTSIEASSREAVSELHRLLGFLRADGAFGEEPDAIDGADMVGVPAPQPQLADLPALVERVDGPRLRVTLRTEGAPGPIPTAVELSAYRIVQEALTNTLRHAGASRAEVVIRHGADRLDVEVVDDGSGAGGPGQARTGVGHHGAGLGLVGMRERTLLHGGTFSAGDRPGGGFEVSACFPLGAAR